MCPFPRTSSDSCRAIDYRNYLCCEETGRELTERKRDLYMMFIHLEKVYDIVPGEERSYGDALRLEVYQCHTLG